MAEVQFTEEEKAKYLLIIEGILAEMVINGEAVRNPDGSYSKSGGRADIEGD